MSNINHLAEVYYELNETKNRVTKELKPINEEIKSSLAEVGLSKLDTENGYRIEIGTQNRSTVDEEKLVALLKLKGFNEAIKTIEVPDEALVERLVFSGELSPEEYSACINQKIINTLTIKKI